MVGCSSATTWAALGPSYPPKRSWPERGPSAARVGVQISDEEPHGCLSQRGFRPSKAGSPREAVPWPECGLSTAQRTPLGPVGPTPVGLARVLARVKGA